MIKINVKTSVLEFVYESSDTKSAQYIEDIRNTDAHLKIIKECIDKVSIETIKIKQA